MSTPTALHIPVNIKPSSPHHGCLGKMQNFLPLFTLLSTKHSIPKLTHNDRFIPSRARCLRSAVIFSFLILLGPRYLDGHARLLDLIGFTQLWKERANSELPMTDDFSQLKKIQLIGLTSEITDEVSFGRLDHHFTSLSTDEASLIKSLAKGHKPDLSGLFPIVSPTF